MDRLIDRKSSLRSRTLAESEEKRRQIAALSASARDLTNLIDRIEQTTAQYPHEAGAAAARYHQAFFGGTRHFGAARAGPCGDTFW